jgi:hypothetical protein
MDALLAFLRSPLVDRIGWTLLHSLWQGAVVAALLKAALGALRGRRPPVAYGCACVAMVAMLVLPIATFVVLGIDARDATLRASMPARQVIAEGRPAVPANGPLIESPVAAPTMTLSPPPPSFPRSDGIADPNPRPSEAVLSLDWRGRITPVLPWAVLAWAAGVGLLSIWNLGGWVAVHQLRFLSAGPVGPDVEALMAPLAVRAGFDGPLRLMRSALATTPMVVGALRPVILLPASLLTNLSVAQLESILAHELAHVRRHDYLANLLQCVIETLLFYHPAVWWVSRQVRTQREHCCDDFVMSITRDRATYASALAALANVRVPALAPAAAGGTLLPRLRRILGIASDRHGAASLPSGWAAGTIVVACIAVAAVIHVASFGQAAKTPDTAKAGGAPAATAPDDRVTIRGRVIDPENKPLAGARVATVVTWPARGDIVKRAVIHSVAASDADGRFEIAFSKSALTLSPFELGVRTPDDAERWKSLTLSASAPGWGVAWRSNRDIKAGEDVVLQLVPDRAFEGRIVGPDGKPVAGVELTPEAVFDRIPMSGEDFGKSGWGLAHPLEAIGLAAPAVTDAEGRFSIRGLGRDRFISLIRFKSDVVMLPSERAVTKEGPNIVVKIGTDPISHLVLHGNPCELTAQPAVAVTGVVRDATTKRPLAGVRVRTYYSLIERETVTDERGRYRLAGLQRETKEGSQVAIQVMSDASPYVPAIFSIPRGVAGPEYTQDVELHGGVWITGKVTDAATGKPVPAEIDYSPFKSNKAAEGIAILDAGWAQSSQFAYTQPDGSYKLVGLPGRGVVGVRAFDSGYRWGAGFDQIKERNKRGQLDVKLVFLQADNYHAAQEVNVPNEAGGAKGVDFQLDAGKRIHVVCVDADGKAIAVAVQVRGLWGGMTDRGRMSEEKTGEFDVIGLTAGEKRVIYVTTVDHKLGRATVVKAEDAPDGRLTLKLPPVATVTGRLVDAEGKPVEGGRLRVDAMTWEPGAAHLMEVESQRSRADGKYTLKIAVGVNYLIGGSHDPYGGNYERWILPTSLEPGTTTEMGDYLVRPGK